VFCGFKVVVIPPMDITLSENGRTILICRQDEGSDAGNPVLWCMHAYDHAYQVSGLRSPRMTSWWLKLRF